MNAMSVRRFVMSLGIVVCILGLSPQAEACSRVLWADGKAVVVGRSMDWILPMPTDLYALPRGVKRDGMTGKNTLTWTAKYGTLVAVPHGGGAADGMNEKRFTAHLLWLAESDYGKVDPDRQSLSLGLWLQYYLDNFATVKEAVEFTEKTPFQLVTGVFDGKRATVHLAIEDATGDSAIIQYIDGKPRIHHGKEYTVMTNSPPYDEQLKHLKQFEGFGGDKRLPGTTEAADRFVRAAFYLKRLPEPQDYRQRIASIFSVMRNVSQPFGIVDPARPDIAPTRWRTVGDLTNGIYYFESATSPNLIWVKLKELDFSEGTAVRKLNLVKNPDLIGDSTKQFERAKPFVVPLPELK